MSVVKAIDSQRFDKGKEVALVENGLGFTQAVESYRERGIILKEAKRRRADIGLEDPDKSEEDVNYMVVDPKKRLVVGPVFQAHRDQWVPWVRNVVDWASHEQFEC